MRLPYRWLIEYIALPPETTPEQVAGWLTQAGVETTVEGGSASDVPIDFTKIVVGEIQTLSPHPNADRLQLAQVHIGKEKSLQMVSGAKNIAPGQKVPVALHGARLASGMVIKRAKFRGVLSEGMMCSKRELGAGEDTEGIWILPQEVPVGKSVGEWVPKPEAFLELDVLPNRGDLLSVRGVVREVCAGRVARGEGEVGAWEEKFVGDVPLEEQGGRVSDAISVTVTAPDLCPRYMVRVVRGVRVAPSPAWLQTRLQQSGVRPINNVVDVTNYILLLWGQPLHAFDLATLSGKQIVVRRAAGGPGDAGEKIKLLDGTERPLSEAMLVIADATRPVALAGVMGGQATEITEQTKDVLIESACFQPQSVRRTARALGLRTESSVRFERGVDWDGVGEALDQAAALMAELGGGGIASGKIDCVGEMPARVLLSLRFSKLNAVLGYEIAPAMVVSILSALGFRVQQKTDGGILSVQVPSFRSQDVTREIDLIEEVARIWGYRNVPETPPPTGELGALQRVSPEESLAAVRQIREGLVGQGFLETIATGFVDGARYVQYPFLTAMATRVATLQNPLSQDRGTLRFSLLPGLLEMLQANVHRGERDLACFEVGRVFGIKSDGSVWESPRVAAVVMGEHGTVPWDFFLLKGVLWRLFDQLGLAGYQTGGAGTGFFHPKQATEVVVGAASTQPDQVVAGYLGGIHVDLVHDLALPPVWGFEVDLDTLLAAPKHMKQFRPFSPFPSVRRDLSLLVAATTPHAALSTCIQQEAGEWLERLLLVDVFSGVALPRGKVSMTYTLILRHPEKTLSEEEVNQVCNRVVKALEDRFAAQVRGMEEAG